MDVAQTIIKQLGGIGRLSAMTGAYNFIYDTCSIQFKFRNRTGPNFCKVTLDPDDTYTVEFGRLVKWELRQPKKVEGIYCDGLIPLFEKTTGLYLSL